jgi:CheY-like chemotaxis protein/MinD-like ATPase involved in chromosome partitioning or flagellar assembly
MATKIVVAEDDLDTLKITAMILQRNGFEVFTAKDGQEALRQIAANTPDLVILDVMMPYLSGYEVCQQLRADPDTADIPIIMFTAKVLTNDKVAGFEAGADDYLTKPIQPAELTARIKTLLARRSSGRQAASQASGMVIGFIGAKGGVGTTTLALNVATLLAQHDPVILADVRPGQGGLGLMLGVNNQAGMTWLLKRTIGDVTRQSVESELLAHRSGLKLLLSSSASEDSRLAIEPPMVAQIVRQLRSLCRTIVLDLGAGLTPWTAQLMREVQEIGLIIEPTSVSIALATSIIEDLVRLEVTSTHINLILMNHVQSSVQMTWQDIQHTLHRELLAVIPPAAELAFRAVQEHVAMVALQPTGTLATQFGKIASAMVAKRKA